mgnify:CR=1 FL=1
MKACFECDNTSDIHDHHVIPLSRGGTRTIPLCGKCHAMAHHRDKNMSTSALTKEGMKKVRSSGRHIGRPWMGHLIDSSSGLLIAGGKDLPLVVKILELRYVEKMSYQAIADWMSENTEGRTFIKTHIYNTCKRHDYKRYQELSIIAETNNGDK